MKKILVVYAIFAALVLVVSCGGGSKTGDTSDTGEVVNDEDTVDTDLVSDTEPSGGDTTPDNETDADTGSVESPKEGIYLGIIGFNYQLNPRPISYLTNSNMTEFQNFIEDLKMDDGTALYFADYTALGMMRDYTPVPPKLSRVALVTFTDGEDTSSDGPINDPENYNDPEVYLNAIHNKIKNEGIHGHSVEAYSIGLRSGDTGSDFMSRLEKLASDDNAFEVSDMEEVKERFKIIAESLYSTFKTIDIDFKVLGNYSDGTRMRFTFDISCDHGENVCEKNGINSNLYIDATYHRNGIERSFDNFAYHGFSGNLTTVECGERDEKGFYPCKFENLQFDNMDTEIKQIELWKNDNNEWKHENEALKQEDSKINESKNSALIMLVLDCTTSLGNSKFNKLKEAGKEFIETLVNGVETQNDTTISDDDNNQVSDNDSESVDPVSDNDQNTLPECSQSSGTPCKDSSSGLTWSARVQNIHAIDTFDYCTSYSENGLSGWHLPTIDELKTLLIAVRVTNNCQVSETNNCLSEDCWSCSTCTQAGTQSLGDTSCSSWGTFYNDGRYSKFGEIGSFWSASSAPGLLDLWHVRFGYGAIYHGDSAYHDIRCVKSE